MPDKEYLTPGEVAELLGLSERTIMRHIASGEIPARKLGGRWIIKRSALDRALSPNPPSSPRPRRSPSRPKG